MIMTKIMVMVRVVIGYYSRSSIVEWERCGQKWCMRWSLKHDRGNATSYAICHGRGTSRSSCCVLRGKRPASWSGHLVR